MSYYTATILSDLNPKSHYKYTFWAGATLIPVTCAYLRVEGGRHFPTDVIAGTAAGGIVGYLIPTLHKYDSEYVDLSVLSSLRTLGLSADINLNRSKYRSVDDDIFSISIEKIIRL